MDPVILKQVLVPIVLFLSVLSAFKFAVDALLRYRFLKEGVDEHQRDRMLAAETQARRLSAMRWGLFLVAIGLGLGLISLLKLTGDDVASFAILAIAAGLAQLVFHRVSQTPA